MAGLRSVYPTVRRRGSGTVPSKVWIPAPCFAKAKPLGFAAAILGANGPSDDASSGGKPSPVIPKRGNACDTAMQLGPKGQSKGLVLIGAGGVHPPAIRRGWATRKRWTPKAV